MTTNKKPTKKAKRPAGKPSGRTSARDNGTPGQEQEATVPATLAGDLKPGDIVYPPVSGTSSGVLVEKVEPFKAGNVDRVRIHFYGQTTGLRSTLAVRADQPIRTEPL